MAGSAEDVMAELAEVERELVKHERQVSLLRAELVDADVDTAMQLITEFAQLQGLITDFQEKRVDSILVGHLQSGKEEARSKRKSLNARCAELLDIVDDAWKKARLASQCSEGAAPGQSPDDAHGDLVCLPKAKFDVLLQCCEKLYLEQLQELLRQLGAELPASADKPALASLLREQFTPQADPEAEPPVPSMPGSLPFQVAERVLWKGQVGVVVAAPEGSGTCKLRLEETGREESVTTQELTRLSCAGGAQYSACAVEEDACPLCLQPAVGSNCEASGCRQCTTQWWHKACKKQLFLQMKCPGGHDLRRYEGQQNLCCDVCNQLIQNGGLGCAECDWDICKDCARKTLPGVHCPTCREPFGESPQGPAQQRFQPAPRQHDVRSRAPQTPARQSSLSPEDLDRLFVEDMLDSFCHPGPSPLNVDPFYGLGQGRGGFGPSPRFRGPQQPGRRIFLIR